MTKGELSIGLKVTNTEEWAAIQKYLEEEKTKVLNLLLNSMNEIEMYRAQGQIKSLDTLLSLNARFQKTLKEMSNA